MLGGCFDSLTRGFGVVLTQQTQQKVPNGATASPLVHFAETQGPPIEVRPWKPWPLAVLRRLERWTGATFCGMEVAGFQVPNCSRLKGLGEHAFYTCPGVSLHPTSASCLCWEDPVPSLPFRPVPSSDFACAEP